MKALRMPGSQLLVLVDLNESQAFLEFLLSSPAFVFLDMFSWLYKH